MAGPSVYVAVSSDDARAFRQAAIQELSGRTRVQVLPDQTREFAKESDAIVDLADFLRDGTKLCVVILGHLPLKQAQSGASIAELEVKAALRANVPVYVFELPEDIVPEAQRGGQDHHQGREGRRKILELPVTARVKTNDPAELRSGLRRALEQIPVEGSEARRVSRSTPPATLSRPANPESGALETSASGTVPLAGPQFQPTFGEPAPHDLALPDEHRDRLAFSDFAKSLCDVIDHPETGSPLTIAVSGPWGVGKTSVANLVQEDLESRIRGTTREPHVIVHFDAWLHDDAQSVGSALVARAARKISLERLPWERFFSPLPSRLLTQQQFAARMWLRLGFIVVVVVFMAMAAALLADLPILVPEKFVTAYAPSYAEEHPAEFAVLVFLTTILIVLARAPTFAPLKRILDPPSKKALKGDIQEIRDELESLVLRVTASGRRIVVFVDNLDRCRPQSAVDVLESTSQFLQIEGVVVVLLADTQALARQVDANYPHLVAAVDAQRADGSVQATHFRCRIPAETHSDGVRGSAPEPAAYRRIPVTIR